MKRTLQKSLDEKWCVRLTTSQPSGDAFDGVVIHIGKSIVALREFRDFQADGVLVFPKKSLAEVRDGELEVCEMSFDWIPRNSWRIYCTSGHMRPISFEVTC